jgi:RNA polymerase sigma-70 factor (ECF subfamily)
MPAVLDLEAIYDEHAQALFGFLLNLTRDETDTRDLLQEIFVRLASKPDLLSGVRQPRAFLFRLAHNLAIDLLRHRSVVDRRTAELQRERKCLFAPAPDADDAALRDALSSAMGELPADQRAVVHLKLWEALTFEEIASTLDIPINTAASRYRYGIDKLRDQLRLIYDEIK